MTVELFKLTEPTPAPAPTDDDANTWVICSHTDCLCFNTTLAEPLAQVCQLDATIGKSTKIIENPRKISENP